MTTCVSPRHPSRLWCSKVTHLNPNPNPNPPVFLLRCLCLVILRDWIPLPSCVCAQYISFPALVHRPSPFATITFSVFFFLCKRLQQQENDSLLMSTMQQGESFILSPLLCFVCLERKLGPNPTINQKHRRIETQERLSSSNMSDNAAALQLFEFAPIPDEKRFIECPVCLDPWRVPQEAHPCGHIFCLRCLRGANSDDTCMVCRSKVVEFKSPNRVLAQMVLALYGKCTLCDWAGTAEQFCESRHPLSHEKTSSFTSAGESAAPQFVTPSSTHRVWEEYGIQQEEYYLVMSAISAAARLDLSHNSSGASSACLQSAPVTHGDKKQSRSLSMRSAQAFARLMGYPSSTADVKRAFEEFGADAMSGGLNDHQLLLWSATIAQRRRTQLSFGLQCSQLVHILTELHESAEFKKNFGVVTTPHEVSYIRNCRSAALNLTCSTGGLVPPSTCSADPSDVSMFKSIFNATRSRTEALECGYPHNGILLVDVLEAFASEDDGFELCAASPRRVEAPCPELRSTPTAASTAILAQPSPHHAPIATTTTNMQPTRACQHLQPASAPMSGGPYYFVPLLQTPPTAAPYYAPSRPTVVLPSVQPYQPPVRFHGHYVQQRPTSASYPEHQSRVRQQPMPVYPNTGPVANRMYTLTHTPAQVNYYGMPPPQPYQPIAGVRR